MSSWLISDTHAYHEKLVVERGYSSAEQMTEAIAAQINSLVHAKDKIYHLGDWSNGPLVNAGKFRAMINCQNITLVRGNHDYRHSFKRSFQILFDDIQDILEVKLAGTPIVLCHYPMESWPKMRYGSLHAHGHCHGNLERKMRGRADVGVDAVYPFPLNFENFAQITGILG